jgi:hypothetical protein
VRSLALAYSMLDGIALPLLAFAAPLVDPLLSLQSAEREAPCDHNYLGRRTLVSHHKAGSTLIRDGCDAVDEVLLSLSAVCVGDPDFTVDGWHASRNDLRIRSSGFGLDESLPHEKESDYPPFPSCCQPDPLPMQGTLVAHMRRNPFEMAVSSYMYDKDLFIEGVWQCTPMTPERDKTVEDLIDSLYRSMVNTYGAERTITSLLGDQASAVHSVARVAWNGTYGAALPLPQIFMNATTRERFLPLDSLPQLFNLSNGAGGVASAYVDFIEGSLSDVETWHHYLNRVGEDEGLLASALFILRVSVQPMVANGLYAPHARPHQFRTPAPPRRSSHRPSAQRLCSTRVLRTAMCKVWGPTKAPWRARARSAMRALTIVHSGGST